MPRSLLTQVFVVQYYQTVDRPSFHMYMPNRAYLITTTHSYLVEFSGHSETVIYTPLDSDTPLLTLPYLNYTLLVIDETGVSLDSLRGHWSKDSGWEKQSLLEEGTIRTVTPDSVRMIVTLPVADDKIYRAALHWDTGYIAIDGTEWVVVEHPRFGDGKGVRLNTSLPSDSEPEPFNVPDAFKGQEVIVIQSADVLK